jgi:hypothetical protein
MSLPLAVLAVYAALVVWSGLLGLAACTRNCKPFLLFGVAFAVFLNARYWTQGLSGAIPFFVGVYDVLINIGLNDTAAAAMGTCHDNSSCSVLGDLYVQHPAWGVAFYKNYITAPEWKRIRLYCHLTFNTVVFVLMHVQMSRPGGSSFHMHKLLGRITFALLAISLICAVSLASEHGDNPEYGGNWSKYGFYSMAAFVSWTAIMGTVAARSGDIVRHRIWMWRFHGSMWGSFWLFRVALFLLDPLLRDVQAAAFNASTWGSAPAGIAIAETIRRRLDRERLNQVSINSSKKIM